MISSPCIGRCQIDEQSNLCFGCARSGAEVGAWRDATPEFRRQVWAELPARRQRLGLNLHRLDWDREALRAFVVESLRPGGTWTAGVPGAIAEFCISPGEPYEIEAKAESIRAFTTRGAIAFDLSDHIRAFSIRSDAGHDLTVLATPRGRARSFLAAGLARIGPDRDAVRAPDRGETLYDFGLNRASASFGVRTASPQLTARLNGVAGLDWRQFLPLIGGELQEVSPARVARHSIGRIEVFTAIPPPGGASPDGPHTHFLPAFLAEKREAPAPIDLPEAYVACAVYHPPRPDGNP